MKEHNLKEVQPNPTGIDFTIQIGSQLGIIAIGVGILASGAKMPVWFGIGMIAVSVAITAAYVAGSWKREVKR